MDILEHEINTKRNLHFYIIFPSQVHSLSKTEVLRVSNDLDITAMTSRPVRIAKRGHILQALHPGTSSTG